MQNALSSKTMATALACLLVAAAITAGAQQRLFEQVWFRLEQRFSSEEAQGQALWLPDYHVTIDAKPLGNDEDMSALTFDASRQTLFTVTNKDSHPSARSGPTRPLRLPPPCWKAPLTFTQPPA